MSDAAVTQVICLVATLTRRPKSTRSRRLQNAFLVIFSKINPAHSLRNQLFIFGTARLHIARANPSSKRCLITPMAIEIALAAFIGWQAGALYPALILFKKPPHLIRLAIIFLWVFCAALVRLD